MAFKIIQYAGMALLAVVLATSAKAQFGALPASMPQGGNAVILVQDGPINPSQLRKKLRNRGYRHIKFYERNPTFILEACRGGDLFKLRIGRRGKIRQREIIGHCGQSKKFGFGSGFPQQLRKRGYQFIKPIKEHAARTVFQACKGDNLYAIEVNARGKITRERKLRACARRKVVKRASGVKPLANDGGAIRTFLKKRRYWNIKILDDRGDTVISRACRRNRQFRVHINRSIRAIVRRQRIGWCEVAKNTAVARAPKPIINFDSDRRISAELCQDAFEYLLDQEKVYFESGSAEIGSQSKPLLRKLARVARRCPASTIIIGGHTDAVGSTDFNQVLSENRAFSVLSFLRGRGLPTDQLSAIGYGESRPVASNGTSLGRALNRRIEFLVEWES